MAKQAKSSNWGGARPGSGPKAETLSVSQVRKMLKKAETYAKEFGKDVDDILLDFIHATGERGEQATINQSIACIKLWKDYTIAKLQEGSEADRTLGPKVFLPEQHPRLEVIDGGKSDDAKSN